MRVLSAKCREPLCCWRAFPLVMARSLIVVMPGLVESVVLAMAVVVDLAVRMAAVARRDAAAPVVRMVTAGAALVGTRAIRR
jgi:hypothetical protein